MAALPAPSEEHPLAGLASFVYEAGYLKRLPRSGWLLAGIEQPETVAEHSWRQSSIEALRTEEGKQLAQAVDSTEPGSWLAAFQASYHELRANAKQRGHRLEGPEHPT